jgi:hypothetical protein
MGSRWVLPVVAGIWFAVTACGGGDDGEGVSESDPTPQELNESIDRPPKIERIWLDPGSDGSVVVTARVRYPRVGAASESGEVALDVYDTPERNALIGDQRKEVTVPNGRSATYRFVVHGHAARRLRAAGLTPKRGARQARAGELMMFRVVHGRNVDADGEIDHFHTAISTGVGRGSGRGATQPNVSRNARPVPTRRLAAVGSATDRRLAQQRTGDDPPRVAGVKANLTLKNDTSNPIRTTFAPLVCIYNRTGSDPWGFNGRLLKPGQSYSAPIEAQQSYFGRAIDSLGMTKSADAANRLYSPEVRAFAFEFLNYYAYGRGAGGTGALPRYESIFQMDTKNRNPVFPVPLGIPPMKNPPSCSGYEEANLLIAGADDLVTGAHDASVWRWQKGATPGLLARLPGGVGISAAHATNTISYSELSMPSSRSNDGSCTTWEWMTCVFEPGSSKESSTKLLDVVWPGTHDSGTASLSTLAADLDAVQSEIKACSGYIRGSEFVSNVIQKLAVTQSTSLREQLDGGIRYLDLRAGWNPKTNRWQIVHTIFSRGWLDTELQDIANWAAKHPNEVIIVRFTHICDDTDAGRHTPQLEQEVQAKDIYGHDPGTGEGKSICDVAFPNPNLGQVTLADVRKTRRNVILMSRDPGFSARFLQTCHPLNPNIKSFFGADDPQGPPTHNPSGSYFAHADPAIAQALNEGIANLPFNQSTRTMNNAMWPTTLGNWNDGSRFVITDLHYELANAAEAVSVAYSGLTGLWQWDWALIPGGSPYTRKEILDVWGTCANIVIADDFAAQLNPGGGGPSPAAANSYVQQIADINASGKPCKPPAQDVKPAPRTSTDAKKEGESTQGTTTDATDVAPDQGTSTSADVEPAPDQ